MTALFAAAAGTTAAAAGTAAATTAATTAAAATAATTTAAATTAAATATAASSISAATLISAASTTFSALAMIGAGYSQSRQLKARAAQEEFNAGLKVTEGIRAQNEVQKRLLQTIGAQRARMGAAGFDLSGGAGSLEENARAQANKQLGIERRASLIGVASRRMRARGFANEAGAALISGVAGGVNQLVDAGVRVAARGE